MTGCCRFKDNQTRLEHSRIEAAALAGHFPVRASSNQMKKRLRVGYGLIEVADTDEPSDYDEYP
jgi:hypothetical protein